MIGTEKQIKWAEDIINEAIRMLNIYIDIQKQNPGNNPEDYVKEEIDQAKEFISKLKSIDDAAYIIRERSDLPDYRNNGSFEQFKVMYANSAVCAVSEFLDIAEELGKV